MKFCTRHWDALREKTKTVGLGALIADSGEQAISNMASEFSDGPTVDNYDPLLAAHNTILSNAMDALGAQALTLFTGDYCPLCVLNQLSREGWERAKAEGLKPGDPCPCGKCDAIFPETPYNYDEWIDFAVQGQVDHWKKLGGNNG